MLPQAEPMALLGRTAQLRKFGHWIMLVAKALRPKHS